MGLAVVALGVRTLRLAPRTATGARRALARAAAALVALVGALHAAGPELVAYLDVVAPPALRAPSREGLAAGLVAFSSVWAWATSPAVRG
ncbi:MAG: hypothetical protein U0324_00765 [Polyangiales bacterium]